MHRPDILHGIKSHDEPLSPRSGGSRSFPALGIAFKNGFGVDCDLHNVTNDESALVKRGVPAYTEVMAVDRGCGDKTCGSWTLVHATHPPTTVFATALNNGHSAGLGALPHGWL